ncbi:hypothetical protein [Collinsella aerofaciens]|uniref:hypothetical protein n=1 Tax=Collinsella aerofaciens TaxID=74426 RepID=UPI00128313C8|nr:hypothetical protein [Collinsella aerofaciens]VWL64691.1 Uncharacterised protein [Collinsella aerofaciens]
MIEIDGIEYRTSVQWEKKHRHVKKASSGRVWSTLSARFGGAKPGWSFSGSWTTYQLSL